VLAPNRRFGQFLSLKTHLIRPPRSCPTCLKHTHIFWLRDESLEETANLPEPDVLVAEIVDDLEAALEQFRAIADDLREE